MQKFVSLFLNNGRKYRNNVNYVTICYQSGLNYDCVHPLSSSDVLRDCLQDVRRQKDYVQHVVASVQDYWLQRERESIHEDCNFIIVVCQSIKRKLNNASMRLTFLL
jgi:hypothetical protein